MNTWQEMLAKARADSAAVVEKLSARGDATDRKELERLAAKVGATITLDRDGYIKSITWEGRTYTPLAFAELARAQSQRGGYGS